MRFDPRRSFPYLLLAASLGGCGASGPEARLEEPVPLNAVTSVESAAGWRLLFDGQSTEGWHVYGRDSAAGWHVEDGALRGSAGSGDLLSNDEYESFELSVEWNLDPGGNSGIFYRVVEDPERFPKSGLTGPEYQVIDDEGWERPLEAWQHTGSNYALYPSTALPTHPAGEWNHSRIVVDGSHVEHWLNGSKVVEYELGSDDWERRLRESKYNVRTSYGRAGRGHVALQDHGGKVRFRNVKIRRR